MRRSSAADAAFIGDGFGAGGSRRSGSARDGYVGALTLAVRGVVAARVLEPGYLSSNPCATSQLLSNGSARRENGNVILTTCQRASHTAPAVLASHGALF